MVKAVKVARKKKTDDKKEKEIRRLKREGGQERKFNQKKWRKPSKNKTE